MIDFEEPTEEPTGELTEDPALDPTEVAETEPEAGSPTSSTASDPPSREGASEPTVSMKLDELSGSNNLVAGIHQDSRAWNLYFQQKIDESGQRSLVASSLRFFSRQRLLDQRSDLVFDRDEVTRLASALEDRRIMLLEGPSGIGKTQLSVATSSIMAQSSTSVAGLYRTNVLGPRLRVDLQGLFTGDEKLQDSVVVLQDALSQGNRDLLRFAARSDSLDLRQLGERLKDAGSYLILTLDEGHDLELGTDLLGYRFRAQGPGVEEQRRLFAQLAEQMLRQDFEDEEKLHEALQTLRGILDTMGEAGLRRLGGVARLKDFLAQYLGELLVADDPDQILDRALADQNRLNHWLLDHRNDLEALSFLVSLAFCFGGGSGLEVRWRIFERIRIAILERLRDELGLDEARRSSSFCDEQDFLDRFEVVLSRQEQGLYLRFENADRPDQLWLALLDTGRRLLACAEPVLVELCGHKDHILGSTAARGLVRMSQLDPFGMVVNRLALWLAQSQNPSDRFMSAAGHLLRAVSESRQTWLSDQCAAQVHRELASRSLPQVVAGLWALAAIGDGRLVSGIRELKRIFDRWLVPPIKTLEQVDLERRLEELDMERSTGSSKLRSDVSGFHEEVLPFVLEALFQHQQRIKVFVTCQRLFVGWALEHGLSPVIAELEGWMPDGEEGYRAAALALVFLGSGRSGVLAMVNSYRIEGSKGGEPVLYSIENTTRGAGKLARFLFKLYLGIRPFPPKVQRMLRRSIRDRLDSWLGLANKSSRHRETVLDLWRALSRKPDQGFRDLLRDLLQEFYHRDPKHHEFAGELGDRMPN